MVTLWKKCPSCSKTKLAKKADGSFTATFQITKKYFCKTCYQQILFILFFSLAVENRKHPRKRFPAFFLVRIPGTENQFARINNISQGGICFSHNFKDSPFPALPPTIDLYNCNDGSSLDQLPIQLIATDEDIQHGIKESKTIVNNRIRFTNLNQAQKKILEACLAAYGTSLVNR